MLVTPRKATDAAPTGRGRPLVGLILEARHRSVQSGLRALARGRPQVGLSSSPRISRREGHLLGQETAQVDEGPVELFLSSADIIRQQTSA